MNHAVLVQAVSGLTAEFGREVMQLAAMVFTTKRLLVCAGRAHNIEAVGLLRTLDACVMSRLIERDIHPEMLAEALAQLETNLLIGAC